MSYVVLARKYRPQTFEDLVGQMPVSQTLRNALESGRLAHAYIFSGPRGVGKTTTARVLAKCMNCAKGPSTTPCNECDSCISISQANSMDDVLEIDGASNRGIEQIRELRENAKYAPARSPYRIYIIDEAHQITKDAFGALLKTLEEPPPHVVFMMATTEVHKIPAPILSRCQRFTLRPIAPDLVLEHLKLICKKENIKVEDEALKNIVRFVEGSLRDALSLLDQAMVFSPEKITTDSLRQLLGLLPIEVIHNFSKILLEGDPSTILKTITQNIQDGIDLTQLGKDLQNHYHILLLNKAGVNDPLFTGGKEIDEQSKLFTYITLERNIRLLARMLEEMRRSETPRAIFEITSLKLGQKFIDGKLLLARIEKLETEGAGAPVKAQTSNGPQQMTKNKVVNFTQPTNVAPIGFSRPAEVRISAPVMPSPVYQTPFISPTTGEKIDSALRTKISLEWESFIGFVEAKKQMMAAALNESNMSLSDTTLTLKFHKSFSEQIVAKSLDQLQAFFVEFFDSSIPIETIHVPLPLSEAKSEAVNYFIPSEPPRENEPAFETLDGKDLSPSVQRALKHFPGILKRQVKDS